MFSEGPGTPGEPPASSPQWTGLSQAPMGAGGTVPLLACSTCGYQQSSLTWRIKKCFLPRGFVWLAAGLVRNLPVGPERKAQ